MNQQLYSRIYGCWLGKSIGGTLGLPVEGWTTRLDFTFYNPVPTEAPPNDDLELQLVWLHLLETRGFALTQRDFGDAWVAHIHYPWDEYGRCLWNLRRGVPMSDVGTFENPFQAGMGSPIRSEIWACICAAKPHLTAKYAALDASLDHGEEGIAGEVFLAVMQNQVLRGESVDNALRSALSGINASTHMAQAIELVMRLHAENVEVWEARVQLIEAHNSENFTHAPLNVGLTVWALLYGEGDFEKSILLAVNGGYDTDCTAATVGATIGLAIGEEGIPTRWREPIGNGVFVGPGIRDIDVAPTLEELTRRTMQLMSRLNEAPEPQIEVPVPTGKVSLTELRGTISIQPLDSSESVLWANGELPGSVKRAGGATWQWHIGETQTPIALAALARHGAKLYVDNELMLDSPADLPYVPATHRCPPPACTGFTPKQTVHQMRLELVSKDEQQEAAVMLIAPDDQLLPWTGEAL